jgi:hypothetical protein
VRWGRYHRPGRLRRGSVVTAEDLIKSFRNSYNPRIAVTGYIGAAWLGGLSSLPSLTLMNNQVVHKFQGRILPFEIEGSVSVLLTKRLYEHAVGTATNGGNQRFASPPYLVGYVRWDRRSD